MNRSGEMRGNGNECWIQSRYTSLTGVNSYQLEKALMRRRPRSYCRVFASNTRNLEIMAITWLPNGFRRQEHVLKDCFGISSDEFGTGNLQWNWPI
jgi:hypothetical protein